MSRGQGRVFRRGGQLWLDYSIRGDRHREPANTDSVREAHRILRERIPQREKGQLVGNPSSVTFADLRALVVQHYDLKELRSRDRVEDCLDHLEGFFGASCRAIDITTARVTDYEAHRQAEGAAESTRQQEKAALRLAFNLAIEQGRLGAKPVIKTTKPRNAREIFFTEGEFGALLLELHDPLLVRYIRLKRLTGWRDNELRTLLWSDMDLDSQTIRVQARFTKGDLSLTFPYGAIPEAAQIVGELVAARREGCPYVFQRAGKPIKDYRGAWKSACVRADLFRDVVDPKTGQAAKVMLQPHDLRRTALQDWLPYMGETELMRTIGWKSPEVMRRYNIRRPEHQLEAIRKRFGTVAAQSEPTTEPAKA